MNGYCSGSLQDKEVINICDGSRLGYVCDLAVDSATGRIISISVPELRLTLSAALRGNSDTVGVRRACRNRCDTRQHCLKGKVFMQASAKKAVVEMLF